MINQKLDRILTEVELIRRVMEREHTNSNPYKEIADCGKKVPQPGDIDYEEKE